MTEKITLEVPRIGTKPADAATVSSLLDNSGIKFMEIGNVNWHEEFPYAPKVFFRIAYSGNSIILNYKVKEITIRAVEGKDNGIVWEDSCVEFFIREENSPSYFNIECNCIGTLLIAEGENRNSRRHLTMDKLSTVRRYSTLGTDTFEEKSAPEEWQVSLIIPAEILGIKSLRGKTMRANFYKCGDMLDTPHFLSWAPIDTPTPDFHRPEFFGTLKFKS